MTNNSVIDADPLSVRQVTALRRQLAEAESMLRVNAHREALRVAEAERRAWYDAQDECLALEQLKRSAIRCLTDRRPSVGRLAQLALPDIDGWLQRASCAYTVISFGSRRDRLQYLRGGCVREQLIADVLLAGGVYDDKNHFVEILQ